MDGFEGPKLNGCKMMNKWLRLQKGTFREYAINRLWACFALHYALLRCFTYLTDFSSTPASTAPLSNGFASLIWLYLCISRYGFHDGVIGFSMASGGASTEVRSKSSWKRDENWVGDLTGGSSEPSEEADRRRRKRSGYGEGQDILNLARRGKKLG